MCTTGPRQNECRSNYDVNNSVDEQREGLVFAKFVWALMSLSREAGSGDFWSGRGWASQSMLGYCASPSHVVAAQKQGAGSPLWHHIKAHGTVSPVKRRPSRVRFCVCYSAWYRVQLLRSVYWNTREQINPALQGTCLDVVFNSGNSFLSLRTLCTWVRMEGVEY